MSQQINLLRAKRNELGAAAWALGALGVVVLCLLAYWQTLVSDNSRLHETAKAGEQEIEKAKSAVQSLQKQTAAQGDAAALAAEIGQLRPRAESVTQLLRDVSSGRLGSQTGFARYFGSLGNVAEPGLWVTAVTIINGGKTVGIGGRAMHNESVMQYARRLNEAFAPYGVHFNSLELTPENVPKPGSAVPSGPATVTFKLS